MANVHVSLHPPIPNDPENSKQDVAVSFGIRLHPRYTGHRYVLHQNRSSENSKRRCHSNVGALNLRHNKI